MDRKKKLETSLEGLFSRSKEKGESAVPEEKTEPPAAAASPEKPKKTPGKTAAKTVSVVSLKEEKEKKASKKDVVEVQKTAAVEEIRPASVSAPARKEPVSTEKVASAPVEKPEPPKVSAPVNKPESEKIAETRKEPEPIQPEVEKEVVKPAPKIEMAVVPASSRELLVAEDVSEAEIQLLVFEINSVAYAIDVNMVQTIIKPQSVFLVPGTVEYLKGLINLRGDVVPVIDMRTRFDMSAREVDKDTRFVVVEVEGIKASMVVDKVHGVETIPLNVIEKPSGLVMDIDNRYLTGMARYNGQIILVLDLMQTIRPETADQR